jgi:hypothetical protein
MCIADIPLKVNILNTSMKGEKEDILISVSDKIATFTML